MAKKTWMQKRDIHKPLKVVVVDKDYADIHAGERVLIANPGIYDNYIRQIPKGKEVNVKDLRKDLALTYHADNSCPLVTGIFLRIIAEAAYEEWQNGKPLNTITPFWRVICLDSPLAKKLSFGTEFLKERRQKEKLEN